MLGSIHRNHADGDGRIVSISPIIASPEDRSNLNAVATTDKGVALPKTSDKMRGREESVDGAWEQEVAKGLGWGSREVALLWAV